MNIVKHLPVLHIFAYLTEPLHTEFNTVKLVNMN